MGVSHSQGVIRAILFVTWQVVYVFFIYFSFFFHFSLVHKLYFQYFLVREGTSIQSVHLGREWGEIEKRAVPELGFFNRLLLSIFRLL